MDKPRRSNDTTEAFSQAPTPLPCTFCLLGALSFDRPSRGRLCCAQSAEHSHACVSTDGKGQAAAWPSRDHTLPQSEAPSYQEALFGFLEPIPDLSLRSRSSPMPASWLGGYFESRLGDTRENDARLTDGSVVHPICLPPVCLLLFTFPSPQKLIHAIRPVFIALFIQRER